MSIDQMIQIVADDNSKHNWRIIGASKRKFWVEQVIDNNIRSYCKIFEVDIKTGKKSEILLEKKFDLQSFYCTKKFLYFIFKDSSKIFMYQLCRKSRQMKRIWEFDSRYVWISIKKIIKNDYILISCEYLYEENDSHERYELINLNKQELILIHADDDYEIDTYVYMKKIKEIIYILKDSHVTPSDKIHSCGKIDSIVINKIT